MLILGTFSYSLYAILAALAALFGFSVAPRPDDRLQPYDDTEARIQRLTQSVRRRATLRRWIGR